jgi:hypothetical protein
MGIRSFIPSKDDEKKKTYTWQEIRFIVFVAIVYLFEHHYISKTIATKNPKYFSQLVRTILQKNCWLQSLESFNKSKEERWNYLMSIFINRLNVDDIILETLWTNDKIKIPIAKELSRHVNVERISHTDDEKDGDRFCAATWQSIIQEKQIQLLGRYIDPSVCQMILATSVEYNSEKVDTLFLVQNHHFSKLFDKGRIYYEERKIAKIAALVKLLNDEKLLLPEVNKIVISFCF